MCNLVVIKGGKEEKMDEKDKEGIRWKRI